MKQTLFGPMGDAVGRFRRFYRHARRVRARKAALSAQPEAVLKPSYSRANHFPVAGSWRSA